MIRSDYCLLSLFALAVAGCGQTDRPIPAGGQVQPNDQPDLAKKSEVVPLESREWRRFTSADGVCSAEFPQPPKNETRTTGGVELTRLTLSIPGSDITYRLTYADIQPAGPPATDEDRLDSARDALMAQPGGKFVREEKISQNGVPGRYLEFIVGDKYATRTKLFVLGARVYQLIAVTPRNTKEDDATKRFWNSFQFEKSKE
jgi:hypothetical protein